MIRLIITSIIWAFSFSLIGVYLSGKVDVYFSIFIRFTLGTITLLPFFKPKILSNPDIIKLFMIGMIQIGLMYICYFHSFLYLPVYLVILSTITTPLYITIFADILQRRFSLFFFLCAIVAILGGLIILYRPITQHSPHGLILIQLANICFALGQVSYRHLFKGKMINDLSVFFLFYLGALILIIPVMMWKSDFSKLPSTTTQWLVLFWLGIVASGICYYLWNSGARKVSSGTLATMNNLLIPLGITVDLLFWHKQTNNFYTFLLGTGLILGSIGLSYFLFSQKQSIRP